MNNKIKCLGGYKGNSKYKVLLTRGVARYHVKK